MADQRKQEERQVSRYWKEQPNASQTRVNSVSDLGSTKVLKTKMSALLLRSVDDRIDEDLQNYEDKLSKANRRAELSKQELRNKAASLN